MGFVILAPILGAIFITTAVFVVIKNARLLTTSVESFIGFLIAAGYLILVLIIDPILNPEVAPDALTTVWRILVAGVYWPFQVVYLPLPVWIGILILAVGLLIRRRLQYKK